MGRREHGVLELRGILPRPETADGAEFLIRPHRHRCGRAQHSASRHDERRRVYRVNRQARHAAQSLSDAAARAARRHGRSSHRRTQSALMRLSMIMTNRTKLVGAMLVVAAASASAQSYPSHQITNGEITATVYLPDAKNGFYKTTRFDWSGAIGSLKYKGHDYYGTWWSKITDIYDFG